MSMQQAEQPPRFAQPLKDVLNERRGGVRFPVVRDVRYEVKGRGSERKSGFGKTVNMGSGGMLFTAPEALDPGQLIELSISWPVQLDGKCALQLVTRGRIMRCEETKVAVRLQHHEFRTRSSPGFGLVRSPGAPSVSRRSGLGKGEAA